jgi:hypothetical protein
VGATGIEPVTPSSDLLLRCVEIIVRD